MEYISRLIMAMANQTTVFEKLNIIVREPIVGILC